MTDRQYPVTAQFQGDDSTGLKLSFIVGMESEKPSTGPTSEQPGMACLLEWPIRGVMIPIHLLVQSLNGKTQLPRLD
jgi:hypothetical protein